MGANNQSPAARMPKGWSLSPQKVLAKSGTPVVDAMRCWLAGDASVPSIAEFLDRFGNAYRNHLRTRFDERLDVFSSNTRSLLTASTNFLALHLERNMFIREFAFAVPTREALDCLAQYSPLLEIGAGSGAWAKLLAMRGADIIATDPCEERFSWGKIYHPVLPLAGKTAVRRWSERNVFCSWPSLSQTWLRQAARAMLPGRALIVVREDAAADERTWDYVKYAFKPVAIGAGGDDWIELPNWYYLHDHLEVWIKKTRSKLAETSPLARDPDNNLHFAHGSRGAGHRRT